MWPSTLVEEAGCPACASGWHTRCLHPDPDLADDGDGSCWSGAVTGC